MSANLQFFYADGVLADTAPSYVVRPADYDLLDAVRAGALCYLLTPRQMGKSSLLAHAAHTLHGQGYHTAQIDMAGINPAPADGWFMALAIHLVHELRLDLDGAAWWHAHRDLAAGLRFSLFLRELLPTALPGQLVLLFDNVEAALRLSFHEEFFAAIRAAYDARAEHAASQRLSIVLAGGAAASALARERARSPFAVGRRIELSELTFAEASQLIAGLDEHSPGQGERILRRIFYWTNGHPYLTQKLCQTAVGAPAGTIWSDSQVDRMVDDRFFSERGVRNVNLAAMRSSIAGMAEPARRAMLEVYSRVYHGEAVADERAAQPAHERIELSGLVRVERGKLRVRNGIYRRVFGEQWLKEQLPAPPRPLARPIAVALLALALLGGGGYLGARALGLLADAPATAAQISMAAPTSTAQPSPTPAPPTNTAAPTAAPTATPTEVPTAVPTTAPTAPAAPAPTNTAAPTLAPTSTPAPATVPSATPTPAAPTEAATPAPTEAATPAPTEAATPAPTAPTAATPTTAPLLAASCSVVQPVTIHARPNDDTNLGTLSAGITFVPEARDSADDAFVWVKVPGAGWVYAGATPRLVSCSGLAGVPVG